MMSNNYILIEMKRWQTECLDFLTSKDMSIEEKTNIRIGIFSLTYKELCKKVKEIRKMKQCKHHSPWRGRGGELGKCVHCNFIKA